jgi:hypothetical protein
LREAIAIVHFQFETLLRTSINPDIRREEAASTIVDVFAPCAAPSVAPSFLPNTSAIQ